MAMAGEITDEEARYADEIRQEKHKGVTDAIAKKAITAAAPELGAAIKIGEKLGKAVGIDFIKILKRMALINMFLPIILISIFMILFIFGTMSKWELFKLWYKYEAAPRAAELTGENGGYDVESAGN